MTNDKSTLDRVVETYRVVNDMYGSLTALRAAMVAIPVVGGPIDMLLEGGMTGTRLGRLEDLAAQLRARIGGLEKTTADLHSEEFADLIAVTFRRATETRSKDKRGRFAQIIANQVAQPRPWDEAETAVRLLAELEDIHIEILSLALGPPVQAPMLIAEHPIVSPLPNKLRDVDEVAHPIVHLPIVLPHYPERSIQMACHDLFSRGLMFDTGITKWDGQPMQQLAATRLADWFAKWITEVTRRGDT